MFQRSTRYADSFSLKDEVKFAFTVCGAALTHSFYDL